MKVSPLILSLVLMCTLSACGKDKNVASNALSGCVLDEPVEAKASNQKEFYYEHVITDQGEAKAFSLFTIENSNQESGFMGGAIWMKSGQRYGFANSYEGNINISENTQEIQGVQVLTTTHKDSEDAVANELKVAYKDEKILGVTLTYQSGVGTQTICVKSMKKSNAKKVSDLVASEDNVKPSKKPKPSDIGSASADSSPAPSPSPTEATRPNFAAPAQEAADLGYFYPDLSDAKTYWYFPLSIKKKLTRPNYENENIPKLYYSGSFDFQPNNIKQFASLKGISPENIKPITDGTIYGGYCSNTSFLSITPSKGHESLDPNVRIEFSSLLITDVMRVESGELKNCFLAVALGKDQDSGVTFVNIEL